MVDARSGRGFRWPARAASLCAVLVPFRHSFANTDAALLLVAGVVAVAALGNRPGGWLAAVSAGIWFDFFLTKPYEHFSITSRTDIETTVLLLVVGVGVTELAVWGRPSACAGWSAGGLPRRTARRLRGGRGRRVADRAGRPGFRAVDRRARP